MPDKTGEPLKKPTPIQPTKEGAETIKQLAAQGEERMKRASPAGEGHVEKKSLQWLKEAVEGIPGASLKKVKEKGYGHALVINRGHGKKDVWYVQEAGFGESFEFDFTEFTLINKDDPGAIAFFARNANEPEKNAGHILDVLNEARRNAESQKNDPAGAKGFDLPKGRPIGYLCFNGFDEGDKKEREQYYEYSHALPELLKSCGYDMVCLDNKKRIEQLQGSLPNAITGLVANPTLSGLTAFAATPQETNAKLVERQVGALYQQGVRDFYLNFLTHGDRKAGMKGADGEWLNGEDIKQILLKYKDCTFAIDATGCEGGGLIGMMRDFKDDPKAPEGRVGVFVHTKEELSIYSYEYQAFLIKQLKDMADGVKGAPKTYGEAHHRADIETKRTTSGRYDPEFWKSMPGRKSLRTAKNEPRPDPLEDAARQYFAGHTPSPENLEPQHSLAGAVRINRQKILG
jgi:hypothetical protein